jgi:hypothetical protein
MIAADARDVVRMGQLHVRETVMRRRDAVRGARRLDRVERRSQRAIADHVNMQIEAREMHALDVLELDRTLVLELAVRNPALARMKAVGLHERRGLVGILIQFHVLAGIETDRGRRVDIPRDGRVPGGVGREHRLQVRLEHRGVAERRRHGERIRFHDTVGEQLDEVGAQQAGSRILCAQGHGLGDHAVVVDLSVRRAGAARIVELRERRANRELAAVEQLVPERQAVRIGHRVHDRRDPDAVEAFGDQLRILQHRFILDAHHAVRIDV